MKISQFRAVRTAPIAAVVAVIASLSSAYAQDAPPPVVDNPPPASGDTTPPANGDVPVAVAPPVGNAQPATEASNVWNWQDVPEGPAGRRRPRGL